MGGRRAHGSKNGYGRNTWTGTKDGHLAIVADEHVFQLRLHERGVHTRGPWEREVKLYRNVSRDSAFYADRDLPSGPYDAGATGQLVLELSFGGRYRGRQSHFADRLKRALEERLPYLFREIEDRLPETRRDDDDRRVAPNTQRTLRGERPKTVRAHGVCSWRTLPRNCSWRIESRRGGTKPTPGVRPSRYAPTATRPRSTAVDPTRPNGLPGPAHTLPPGSLDRRSHHASAVRGQPSRASGVSPPGVERRRSRRRMAPQPLPLT